MVSFVRYASCWVSFCFNHGYTEPAVCIGVGASGSAFEERILYLVSCIIYEIVICRFATPSCLTCLLLQCVPILPSPPSNLFLANMSSADGMKL